MHAELFKTFWASFTKRINLLWLVTMTFLRLLVVFHSRYLLQLLLSYWLWLLDGRLETNCIVNEALYICLNIYCLNIYCSHWYRTVVMYIALWLIELFCMANKQNNIVNTKVDFIPWHKTPNLKYHQRRRKIFEARVLRLKADSPAGSQL